MELELTDDQAQQFIDVLEDRISDIQYHINEYQNGKTIPYDLIGDVSTELSTIMALAEQMGIDL